MEKVKTTKLQMLRPYFEKKFMNEYENIDSIFTQVIGLFTQLISHGERLEEMRIIDKILRFM